MRHFGNILLALGVIIGVAGAAGLMMGLHATGMAWIVGIGLAKLTLLASGGLLASGAGVLRLARRAEDRRLLATTEPHV